MTGTPRDRRRPRRHSRALASLLASLAAAVLLAALAPGAAHAQPNRLLAGIWTDQLLTFDQEALEFEKIGSLRHGAATNASETASGRYFVFITNRMESVEIFDVATMAVVDEFSLSSGSRRVRFMSAIPGPDARRVFLIPVVVEMEADRFLHQTRDEVLVFDRERGEVTHKIPTGGLETWRPNIHFSPDGSRMYFVNDEIVELDGTTFEELGRTPLDVPLAPGYGGIRGHQLYEHEPGRLFGIYRTVEPMQGLDLFGVLEIRLPEKRIRRFEVGPAMRLAHFAVSPDGSLGYAGLGDAAIIDMASREVILRRKGFERGRTNTSLIVSHDGKRVFVSGVGHMMRVYDAATLELETEVFAGGDFIFAPREIRYRAASGN